MTVLLLDPISTQGILTIIVPIISGLVGLVVGRILERYKNRIVYLRQNSWMQHLALSGQIPGATIQILYNGSPSNSLYNGYLELTNNSNQDIEDFTVHLSVNESAAIYQNSGTLYEDAISKVLLLDKEFHAQSFEFLNECFSKDRKETEIEEIDLQRRKVHFVTNKIYHIPVLNRKATIAFSFLIDCPTGTPDMLATIGNKKGIKIVPEITDKYRNRANLIQISIISCVLYFASLFPIINYSPSISWAIWINVVSGIACTLLAFPINVLIKWIVSKFKQAD